MKINKKIDNVYHIEFGLNDDRANARIYRYDTGQLIKFYDIPDDVEVQFSNEHSTNGTINKRITDSMVQIPDSLLTSKDNIIAYIKYIDENSETTTKLIKFGLLDRAKPGDYVSPDEEPSFRSFVEEQLKEAKETVEKNKDYLKETIENTEKSKEYMDATDANRRTVEGLTEKNKEYATQTENNAESANTSASNASESASNASQSASNAKGSADNASVSAKEAKDAAVKAGTSESNAKEAENNINSAVTEFEQTKRESLTEIGNLTTNSKKEISDLTDAKKTELNKINDDITQNAGELKEAIVNAADAKKEEINQKGLEVLQSLPEDMGKIQDTTLIKSTESGTEINLTDSSDMNIQELHLFGKSEQKTTKGIQLLNLKDAKGGTGEGVTYTINADGSVARKGTATGYVGNVWMRGAYYENTENKEIFLILEAGKTYYIKDVVLVNGQVSVTSKNKVESNYLVTITENEYPEGFKVTGIRNPAQTSGKTYNDIIYPIIAESSTAVDWEEYTGGQPSPSPDYPKEIASVENPVIKIAGKNLLDCSNKEFSTKCYINEKANILGRALQNNYELGYCFPVTQGKYNISASTNFRTAFSHKKLDENANETINVSGVATTKAKATIEAKEDGYIYVCNSTDFYKNEKKLMISKMEANEYEEYKEIQSAQQTCELKGIGDVKDELIIRSDGTGQLVQKIKSYDCSQISRNLQQSPNKEYYYLPAIDKSTTNASRVLSTHFTSKTFDKKWGNVFKVNGNFYFGEKEAPDNISDKNAMKQWLIGNKVKILFQLEEPIITELSSEEVQKILALHTNKPNTTIWNDQNADMQITYIADTKSYIDNKFKELSDAIVASASEAE